VNIETCSKCGYRHSADECPFPKADERGSAEPATKTKTDREWQDFCRPYVYMNGSHEMPDYAAICRAVLALACPKSAQARDAAQAVETKLTHKDYE
jgi:hypothetical protein